MLIFKTKDSLQQFLSEERKKGKTIGFVPTMGALHQGHLSLVERSKQKAGITVCSIYVNPTQFNDPGDLEKYPRNEEKDIQLLRSINCDVCFFPTTEDLYPNGTNDLLEIDLDGLDQKMEGEHRPGHFKGVTTVVKNLFDAVQPDYAFFGEKDYQQLAIIKKMVAVTGINTQIFGCPILREENGLAMSSRNERLSAEDRNRAAFIYETLSGLSSLPSSDLNRSSFVVNSFQNQPDFKLDYFQIADASTLDEPSSSTVRKRAFIAVFLGGVRLIDNIALD